MSFTIPQEFKRKELLAQAEKMLNKCETEKRVFTDSEQKEYKSILLILRTIF
jgi:hypothetical protein